MFYKWLRWVANVALESSGLVLVLTACATSAFAGDHGGTRRVPEIDPASMSAAIAFLAGGLLMLTGRRRSG
jgi:hypothetical protein